MKRSYLGHLFALSFYVSGVLALFLFDFYVAKRFAADEVSEWSGMKSFMMIAGPLILLGLNNVFIRNPHKNSHTLRTSLMLVAGFVVIAHTFNYLLDFAFPAAYYLVAGMYALTLTYMSSVRGLGSNIFAQAVQSCWKIALLSLGIAAIEFGTYLNYEVTWLLLLSLASGVFVGVVLNGLLRKSKQQQLMHSARLNNEDWKFSGMMLISTLTASASAYLELFIVSQLAPNEVSASYFVHFTIFSAAATLASGYFGFYLSPAIRKNPQKFRNLLNWRARYLAALAILFVANGILGAVAFIAFYVGRYEFDYYLAAIIVTTAMMRIIYVLPTAVMGALGKAAELGSFVRFGVGGVVLMGLISLIAYKEGHLIFGVALASFLNWMLRTVAAFRSARPILAAVK